MATTSQQARGAARRPRWALPTWLGWRGRTSSVVIASALVIGLIVLLVACVYVLPDFLVARDVGAKRVEQLQPSDLATAKDGVRRTLLGGIGGLLFVATAFFTWRQIQVSREGQITEQFTKAIDHLGSDQSDVRIGGIYALERIARSSERDRSPIAEILTAYVRQRSPSPSASTGRNSPAKRCRDLLGRRMERLPAPEMRNRPSPELRNLPSLQARKPDIQAAMVVLARRDVAVGDADRLDLTGVDLRRAYLARPKLESARLHGVVLQYSDLQRCNLEAADLGNADLWGADLSWSNLNTAILSNAALGNTNLWGAELEKTDLREARANAKTRWPAGFKPKAAGVLPDKTGSYGIVTTGTLVEAAERMV
jgi:Pentapeptide repeats (8 copies)